MKGQILYIDDNEMDIKVATMALAKLGYECVGFTDYKRAIEWTIENVPQLILLDLQMPGTTGYKLMPLLRAQPKMDKIPIVIVSGKNQAQDVRLAIKTGATDYIIKPIDPMVLQEKVERVHNAKMNDFVEIPVPLHLMPNVHFMNPVTVLGVSEFGIRIASPQMMAAGDTVELGGLAAEQMGLEQVWLRAVHVERRPTKSDYIIQFSFIGIGEKERQVIRRTCRQIWVQSKQEEL